MQHLNMVQQVNRNEKEWTLKISNWRLWKKDRAIDEATTTNSKDEATSKGGGK